MPCTRVVGVVADTRRGALREEPAMQYYLPLGQEVRVSARPTLVVRAAGGRRAEPALLARAVRRELLAMDPSLGYVETATLRDLIDPQTRSWRLGATMFGLFGALALVVAGAGLYSLIAYLVAQRTREIGVRLALGATAGAAAALVVRHGTGLAALGVAAGAAASLAAGRFIAPLLFETSARDPAVFGGVAAALLLVAVAASAVPAARARRVDAAEALRAD
jgi:ABC-type antimicrobial peptide transport system permease subunit